MLKKVGDALRPGGCKHLNKMCHFFLFYLKVSLLLLSFSTVLQKLEKIPACFPEDKSSTICPDHPIQYVYQHYGDSARAM